MEGSGLEVLDPVYIRAWLGGGEKAPESAIYCPCVSADISAHALCAALNSLWHGWADTSRPATKEDCPHGKASGALSIAMISHVAPILQSTTLLPPGLGVCYSAFLKCSFLLLPRPTLLPTYLFLSCQISSHMSLLPGSPPSSKRGSCPWCVMPHPQWFPDQ